jgi:hypothetical protein
MQIRRVDKYQVNTSKYPINNVLLFIYQYLSNSIRRVLGGLVFVSIMFAVVLGRFLKNRVCVIPILFPLESVRKDYSESQNREKRTEKG